MVNPTRRVAERVQEAEARFDRLRRRYPWLDHLKRAADSYNLHYGNHYAAAIAYFSVLSLFPLLMIAFSVTGFVLASQPQLLHQLRVSITATVPGTLGAEVNGIVDQAIASREAVGVIGLLVAGYSGIGWMGNVRDALTAQWGQERPQLPFLRTALRDLAALVALGVALAVCFGLTATGTGAGATVLRWAGLAGSGWARALLLVLTVLLALAANWLLFLYALTRLPREPVTLRSAMRGALVASVGFEVLKQLGAVYLRAVTGSPAGAAFGPILGVLVFANLVARFLLYVTAWMATARENVLLRPVPPPPPAVIRPIVRVRSGPDGRTAAGLLGLGVLAGLLLCRGSRRRR
ncbi:inner membrane protein YhjD [Gandjariella thermophila]|uniref:Inner membrane protein YhjD n=1 Tax=Gandjariella thermophila TaxID=1931992 RepID=A0A4D4J230_9PSEU|nr:inner membrane protein YhjD [Gandjariella thermophila]GDY29220.1 inner membrane protein YhjD [Gandjariella thermophila]